MCWTASRFGSTSAWLHVRDKATRCMNAACQMRGALRPAGLPGTLFAKSKVSLHVRPAQCVRACARRSLTCGGRAWAAVLGVAVPVASGRFWASLR